MAETSAEPEGGRDTEGDAVPAPRDTVGADVPLGALDGVHKADTVRLGGLVPEGSPLVAAEIEAEALLQPEAVPLFAPAVPLGSGPLALTLALLIPVRVAGTADSVCDARPLTDVQPDALAHPLALGGPPLRLPLAVCAATERVTEKDALPLGLRLAEGEVVAAAERDTERDTPALPLGLTEPLALGVGEALPLPPPSSVAEARTLLVPVLLAAAEGEGADALGVTVRALLRVVDMDAEGQPLKDWARVPRGEEEGEAVVVARASLGLTEGEVLADRQREGVEDRVGQALVVSPALPLIVADRH